jgi:ribosomal protein L11 methyltransferase
MRNPRNHQNNTEPIGTCPYENLFIYYLNGRLRPDCRIAHQNFIGNWEEGEDSVLFFSNPADRQIELLLQQQPHLKLVDNYQMPYDQWLGETFKAFDHGAFRITPPWQQSNRLPAADGRMLPITLDPGLVFGTGTHPTTRECLDALQLAAGSMSGFTALDLGTGTGLLAVAAARLGARSVIGVDLNPLAARTAHRNICLNGLRNRALIVQARAEEMISCPADLLIANIHFDVMQLLVDTRDFLTKKRFVLSGLLRGESKHIAGKLQGYPLRILKQWTNDGIWHTIYGKIDD